MCIFTTYRDPDRLSYYSGPSSDRQDHEATSSVYFWTEIIPRISIGAKNNHRVEVLAAVKCLEKDAQGAHRHSDKAKFHSDLKRPYPRRGILADARPRRVLATYTKIVAGQPISRLVSKDASGAG